jgi:hypothetical protein
MRAIWIALLIALLPLRGWAGDAMAVAMIPMPASSTTSAAQAGDPDCPHADGATHLAIAVLDGAPDTAANHGDHIANADHADHADNSAHLLCDVCNGPVLSTAAPPGVAAAAGHGLHIERKQAFASLAPRHVVKPPIA